MSRVLRPLGEALRFLTLLPVPGLARDAPARLDHASAAFPLVGALVGGVGIAAGALADAVWGDPPLRGLCVVLAWVAVSGGLHQDGLADSCDALLSWRSRERRLEILRDSRVGSMGVLGLFMALSLQAAALAALGPAWWRGALVAAVCGRWAAALGLCRFPQARPDGAGRAFADGVGGWDLALASLAALLLVAAAWWPWGPLLLALVAPLTLRLARAIAASLGGLTGDALGALHELAVTASLLGGAALVRHAPALAALRLP